MKSKTQTVSRNMKFNSLNIILNTNNSSKQSKITSQSKTNIDLFDRRWKTATVNETWRQTTNIEHEHVKNNSTLTLTQTDSENIQISHRFLMQNEGLLYFVTRYALRN